MGSTSYNTYLVDHEQSPRLVFGGRHPVPARSLEVHKVLGIQVSEAEYLERNVGLVGELDRASIYEGREA